MLEVSFRSSLVLTNCFPLFFLIGPTSWAIHVFNLSFPCKWSRADIYTHGSLLRDYNTICKSKMVMLTFKSYFHVSFLVENIGFNYNCAFRYLDVAGQKSSNIYIWNGVALFLGWLVQSSIPQNLDLFLLAVI